jgi:hypothetical protein
MSTNLKHFEHFGPAWNRQPVITFANQYDTRIETGEDYETRTLASLFTLEPSDKPKGMGPGFIPSTYNDFDARVHKVQKDRGVYVALTGDVDKGDHPLERIETLVRAFAGEAAWLIFSSSHARPGSRRWRVIMPLDEPVDFDTWHDAQKRILSLHGKRRDTHGLGARSRCPACIPAQRPGRAREDKHRAPGR